MPEIAERQLNGSSVGAGSYFAAPVRGRALCPGAGQDRLSLRESVPGEVGWSSVHLLYPRLCVAGETEAFCGTAVRAIGWSLGSMRTRGPDEMFLFAPSGNTDQGV